MTDENEPIQHCTLAASVNLYTALERAGIEYLDVDDHRTIVIYHQAILMIVTTEGQATAAGAFNVEFWQEPPNVSSPDPDKLLTTFIEELVATTDATRTKS